MLDSSSCEERIMPLSVTGGGTHEFFSSPTKSSESLGKNYSASETKELSKAILNAVKNRKDAQNAARECKILLKQKADPETLIQLAEELKAQREDHEYYIQSFLPTLKTEIRQSKKLDSKRKIEVEKIIVSLIISDPLSKINNQNNHRSGQVDNNTTKLSSISDSKLGTSEESLELSVSSRRRSLTPVTGISYEESLNLVLNSVNKDEDQVYPKQVVEEEPKMQENESSGNQEESLQVSFQCMTRKKGNMDSNGQATQMTSNQKKDSVQSEKKEERAILNKQKASNYKNNSEVKQPSNRNLHVALVTGCAFLAIGCIVAGAMTSGLVGAGLFAIAALFATAATAELRSSFISSKLTSINVSSLIDNKKLTR